MPLDYSVRTICFHQRTGSSTALPLQLAHYFVLSLFLLCNLHASPLRAQQDNAPKDGDKLRFKWRLGDVHHYKISLKAKVAGEIDEYEADCRMTVGPSWRQLLHNHSTAPQQPKLSAVDAFDREFAQSDQSKSESAKTGSGTGFFISTKGHLLTCAHVVEGADEVTVTLKNKKLPATIELLDTEQDLAILKVKNGRYKALIMADSDKAEIAEDLHVIGFPLGVSLGKNVKVNRGTLAGIVINKNGKRLQIDASVNPGNSGGPVFNDRGQVIGIASSKLAGEGISGIGFAIPANTAVKHLEDRGVDFRQVQPDAGRKMSGTQLVKQVSPGIVLVEGTKTNKLTDDDVEIFYQSDFRKVRSTSSTRRSSYSRQPQNELKSFIVNSVGKIKSSTAEISLPYVGHSFPELLIDQLSQNKSDTWYHQQEGSLLRPVSGSTDAHDAFSGRTIGGQAFGGRSRTSKKYEAVKIRERFEYEITSRGNGKTKMKRNYTLKTTGGAAKPYIDVQGKAEISIDNDLGLTTHLKARRMMTINQGSVTLDVPVLIEVKRIPLTETVAEQLKRASSSANYQKQRAEERITETNKSGKERVEAVLKKIAADFAKNGRSYEINKLKQMQVVPEERKKVISLLKKALVSSRSSDARSIIEAIGVWGTKDEVPMLMKALKSGDRYTQEAAGKALANIGDKSVIKPLVEMLEKATNSSSRYQWKQIVEQLGMPAETELLALLESSNNDTVKAAIAVLEKVGGKQSVKPLEKLLLRCISNPDATRTQTYNIEKAIKAASSRAVAQEIGGVDSLPTPKRRERYLTGVDRDLKQLDQAITGLKQRTGSTYTHLSSLSRLPPVESKRKEVAQLIEPILKNRKTRDSELLYAVKAIGVWGDSTHTKYLLRLIPKAEGSARSGLFKAIGQLGDEDTSDDLLKLLKDETMGFQAVQAFRKLSKETEQELGDWLSSDDVYMRAKAVTVLGQAGGRSAGTKLKSFIKKEGDTIAFTQAIEALAQWETRQ